MTSRGVTRAIGSANKRIRVFARCDDLQKVSVIVGKFIL